MLISAICYNHNMKKNDEIIITIDDIGSEGEGICHFDGITIFVPFALPGEKCKIHILKVDKTIAWAKLIGVVDQSKERVIAPCPYFKKCGGCTLQHASRHYQIKCKRQKIQTALYKYSGIKDINIDMIDSNLDYFYRNKCAFPIREVNGKPSVCMFKINSHEIVKIDKCLIAQPIINNVINIFNEFLEKYNISAYNEQTNQGLIKFLVIRTLQESVLITIVINGNSLPNKNELINMFSAKLHSFGLNLNINTANNNVILSNEFEYLYGLRQLEGRENNISYPISSNSFMQVNDFIKNQIYNSVIEKFNQNDVVIDAYSGAGLLSAQLSKKVKHVYGIEIIEAATKNANELKTANNIQNLTNINGDCAKILPELVLGLKDEDISIVLDPPRKGAEKRVLESIVKANIHKVVYISCNPATLARDIKILKDNGYILSSVCGYNMFPQTGHVETVAVICKNNNLNT